jgi:hypothetical protein
MRGAATAGRPRRRGRPLPSPGCAGKAEALGCRIPELELAAPTVSRPMNHVRPDRLVAGAEEAADAILAARDRPGGGR